MSNNKRLIEELDNHFIIAKALNKKYIGLKIKIPNTLMSYEVIIIPNEAFDNKLEYYKKSYTNDLKLKSFNEIYIDDYAMGNHYREIEEKLLY